MTRPIRSILIANRGEIAVRIIATCRSMGIRTITVYSEYDAELPHACLSDAAYPLGEGSLADTYLNQDKLLKIAEQAQVDAIHPGYGFLSENATFAQRITDAGLCFIGPPVSCIADMGDKIAARKAAEAAGVPVVPGYHGDDQQDSTLMREAGRIGYPVMVKASAGGGGKGMRIVERESDFAAALSQAKSEALNAFGDDSIFVEKYLTSPRHIEVQVFSDTQGHHLHLFERECSIQRRHQKIIEESPSPAIDDTTRQTLTDAAIALAQQIGYVGAGTVEFIMNGDGSVYFLEMNTRLQVEHPVTEAITGLDLVAWQIRVAQGEPLPLTQEHITRQGHAIECRLYAENPEQGYLPSTGTLQHLGRVRTRNVRLDSGYEAGNEVTMHYDPMLAKVIAWAETRDEATRTMQAALKDLTFAGVHTNRAQLGRILALPAFAEGRTTTDFLDREAEALLPPTPTADQTVTATAIAAYLLTCPSMLTRQSSAPSQRSSVWEQSLLTGFRNA